MNCFSEIPSYTMFYSRTSGEYPKSRSSGILVARLTFLTVAFVYTAQHSFDHVKFNENVLQQNLAVPCRIFFHVADISEMQKVIQVSHFVNFTMSLRNRRVRKCRV